uniref:Rx N-terminal domain-containing protein n=1 Tax=Fagus sylvatica TaxID=28930 RepID=A0A2N9GRN5_FAGSY
MAAETFVFNIADNLLGKLGSLAFQEACLVWGVESDLERLEKTLSTVKAVLLDAEEQQFHNQELTVWLGNLREVFYDAQDVLDEFECEALRRQDVETRGSTTRKVRRFFSSSNSLVFRTKMGHQIKEIRARLDEVAADRAKFHLFERSENRHVVRGREMSYSYCPSFRCDRKRPRQRKHYTTSNASCSDGDQNVSVISVVGIGGLGKTALAKLVFNDAAVVDHFELKCWVCVSDEFVLKQLLVKIVKSITGEICNDLDEEQLQIRLRNNLDGKKFLLVLDDVWSEDREKWIELRSLLMGGAKGSKILVTTRSPTVASMMGTMSPYNLEGLPHKQCLSLFVKWAFDEGQESRHPNLVEIGDEIVKKCKGVPLAVKSLGSLLYSKLEECDWLFVKDNDMWKLNKKEGDILSALQLSYNQMPSSLKQCFAYFSLYPKDYQYISIELVQIWMAHDLLQSRNENQESKDIGNQYIDELYSRSFLEDYIDVGYFREFKIHDLAHDLALSVAQKSLFGVTQGYTGLQKLHIVNCGGLISLFPNLKCLTALELLYIENCGKLDLTEGEDNQEEFTISLRAVAFCELPQFVALPQWIKWFSRTLQYMLIKDCPNLTALSEWPPNLISLRLLQFEDCPKLASLPEGKLCLQSLRTFRIRECPELSRRCQPEIGEDWHKIAHASEIYIDDKKIK